MMNIRTVGNGIFVVVSLLLAMSEPLHSQDTRKYDYILLHGIRSDGNVWNGGSVQEVVNTLLKKNAPAEQPSYNFQNGIATIASTEVKKAIELRPGEETIIIAHSMGGLATRSYLQQHGLDKISTVVSIGTPHLAVKVITVEGGEAAKKIIKDFLFNFINRVKFISLLVRDLSQGDLDTIVEKVALHRYSETNNFIMARMAAEFGPGPIEVPAEFGGLIELPDYLDFLYEHFYGSDGNFVAELLLSFVDLGTGWSSSQDMAGTTSFLAGLNGDQQNEALIDRFAIVGDEDSKEVYRLWGTAMPFMSEQDMLKLVTALRAAYLLEKAVAWKDFLVGVVGAVFWTNELALLEKERDAFLLSGDFQKWNESVFEVADAKNQLEWWKTYASLALLMWNVLREAVIITDNIPDRWNNDVVGGSPNDGIVPVSSQEWPNNDPNLNFVANGANHLEETDHPAVRQRLLEITQLQSLRLGQPQRELKLEVQTIGNGTVSLSPAGPTYPRGTEVTLTAIPDAGWGFGGWSGASSATDSSVTIIMDGNAKKVITATFTPPPFLRVNTRVGGGGGGDVEFSPPGVSAGYSPSGYLRYYPEGTQVHLTAVPDTDWYFVGWNGGMSYNPELDVVVNNDMTVDALFLKWPLTITEIGEGGVSPRPGKDGDEDEVILEAEAAPGWQFMAWTGDVTGTANPMTIVMDSAMTVTANFDEQPAGGSALSARVEIDFIDTFDSFAFRVFNNSDATNISTVTMTADVVESDQGIDIFNNGSSFTTSPNVGGNNDGDFAKTVTATFSGSGLAPGGSDESVSFNDLDGIWTNLAVSVRFSDGSILGTTAVDLGDSDDGDSRLFVVEVSGDGSDSAPSIFSPSSPLSSGTEGSSYSATYSASGTSPISWSHTGDLPPALSLSSAGSYSGTPTTAGSYTFTVAATNSFGSDSGTFTHTIDPTGGDTPPSISGPSSPLSPGTEGTSYSENFIASGSSPISWSHTGNLPPGLSLSSAGLYSGTPATAGSYTFTVEATNSFGSDSGPFTHVIDSTGGGGGALSARVEIDFIDTFDFFAFRVFNNSDETNISAVTMTVDVVESDKGIDIFNNGSSFTASPNVGGNNDGNFAKTVTATFSGSGLAPGGFDESVSVNDLDGTWANIVVSVSFSDGATLDTTAVNLGDSDDGDPRLFVAEVSGGGGGTSPTITGPPSALSNGTADSSYSETFIASGSSPIGWSHTGGSLPPGMSFSSAGSYSGTPTTAGSYTFTVEATNSFGSDSGTFTHTIDASGTAPSISAPSSLLSAGTEGSSYSETFVASGSSPISWSLTAGNLPLGMSLSSTGSYSGTPTTAGSYTFTVAATNSFGSDSGSFTHVINSSGGDTFELNTIADDFYIGGVGTGHHIKTQDVKTGYLKFDLSGITGTVVSATLKCVTSQDKPGTTNCFGSEDDSWSEGGLVDYLALGPQLASAINSGQDEDVVWDVDRTTTESQINYETLH